MSTYICIYMFACIPAAHLYLHLQVWVYIYYTPTYISTRMPTYLHTYLHACVHACLHIYLHVCLYMCLDTCVCMYVACVPACICVCTLVCMCAFFPTCIHAYLWTSICTCIHIHAYVKHTCTYACLTCKGRFLCFDLHTTCSPKSPQMTSQENKLFRCPSLFKNHTVCFLPLEPSAGSSWSHKWTEQNPVQDGGWC